MSNITETAATMTLAQFVTEAALYPHSKEHFNLIKESHEFDLMAMCIHNSAFVTESFDLTAEMIDGLAVMTESASADATAFQEKVGEKLTKIWDMIRTGWNKLISAAITMFNNIVKFVTGAKAKRGLNKAARSNAAELVEVIKGYDADQLAAFVTKFMTGTNSVADERLDQVLKHINAREDGTIRALNKLMVAPIVEGDKATRMKKLLLAAITDARQSGNDIKFRYPKFADKVLEAIPEYADIVKKLADNPSTEALVEANAKLATLSASIKKLHIGKDDPTVDTISSMMITIGLENLTAMNSNLAKARDTITSSLADIKKLSNTTPSNGTIAAAMAGIVDTLTKAQNTMMVYTGVAISAAANAMSNEVALGTITNSFNAVVSVPEKAE